MNTYNVHLYRVMCLFFPGITANTPEEAAQFGADRPTSDAERIEECDGETLAALVDVVGDEDFEESRMISLDLVRDAAPVLLTALANLHAQMEGASHDIDLSEATAALAQAAGISVMHGRSRAQRRTTMCALNTAHNLVLTPGPVACASSTVLYAAGEAGDEFIVHEITAPYGENPEDFQTVAFLPESAASAANGRLLSASFNAFTTGANDLGINAVEFAERMQDGGVAKLLEALRMAANYMGDDLSDDPTEKRVYETILAALAQAQGT